MKKALFFRNQMGEKKVNVANVYLEKYGKKRERDRQSRAEQNVFCDWLFCVKSKADRKKMFYLLQLIMALKIGRWILLCLSHITLYLFLFTSLSLTWLFLSPNLYISLFLSYCLTLSVSPSFRLSLPHVFLSFFLSSSLSNTHQLVYSYDSIFPSLFLFLSISLFTFLTLYLCFYNICISLYPFLLLPLSFCLPLCHTHTHAQSLSKTLSLVHSICLKAHIISPTRILHLKHNLQSKISLYSHLSLTLSLAHALTYSRKLGPLLSIPNKKLVIPIDFGSAWIVSGMGGLVDHTFDAREKCWFFKYVSGSEHFRGQLYYHSPKRMIARLGSLRQTVHVMFAIITSPEEYYVRIQLSIFRKIYPILYAWWSLELQALGFSIFVLNEDTTHLLCLE